MEVVVRKPTEGEKIYMQKEAVWECGVSKFNWHYDHNETCLLFEGQATVEFNGGSVSFGAGDLVVFPKGMDCVWNVLVPVKKYVR
ncbi:MAG: cupin domain-containing protein [Hungatella sp.]|jgi:uncharacterized cupin superfamily protein|nr:cupin domain-containing protein [Hungatella sp.]